MTSDQSYHHRSLYPALLEAAEEELAEKGVEYFSLRGVARRSGVSHAAPAHHFGDADGLLTALAARAFERLVAAMETAAAEAAPDALSKLVAIGIGYIDYAESQPHLFSLLFASDRPDWTNPDLMGHADAAFATLKSGVERYIQQHDRDADAATDLIPTVWATAHGLATLFATRRSRNVARFDCEQRRERFESILRSVAKAF